MRKLSSGSYLLHIKDDKGKLLDSQAFLKE
jgi:hypothetical protein